MFGIDQTVLSGLFYAIFIFVIGILTLCIPFFILRIRNEAIKTNRLLAEILKSLGPDGAPENYKLCYSCKARNRVNDVKCIQCGKAI